MCSHAMQCNVMYCLRNWKTNIFVYKYLDVSADPEGNVSTPEIHAELIDISIEEKVSLQNK